MGWIHPILASEVTQDRSNRGDGVLGPAFLGPSSSASGVRDPSKPKNPLSFYNTGVASLNTLVLEFSGGFESELPIAS